MIYLFIALLYIGVMIHLANLEIIYKKKQPLLRAMHFGLIFMLIVWLLNAIVFIAFTPEQVDDPVLAEQLTQVDPSTALFFMLVVISGIGIIIYLMRSNKPYYWIASILPRDSSNETKFNPDSSIHRLAVVLMIFQSIAIVWTLTVSGGLQGLDFSYETPLHALADLASGGVVYIVVAIMGIGWMVRRDLTAVLQRLNLRYPTIQDWLWGIGMAILLYVMLLIATTIWTLIVPPEVLEQQTVASSQLFEAFNSSLFLGFLLALITGISEEILFRGALQPVFGLFATSIFFTILHIQYALTPATLILFIVSLGFGLAKQRASTTASIIAHATYNFIPFLLFTLATNAGIT